MNFMLRNDLYPSPSSSFFFWLARVRFVWGLASADQLAEVLAPRGKINIGIIGGSAGAEQDHISRLGYLARQSDGFRQILDHLDRLQAGIGRLCLGLPHNLNRLRPK